MELIRINYLPSPARYNLPLPATDPTITQCLRLAAVISPGEATDTVLFSIAGVSPAAQRTLSRCKIAAQGKLAGNPPEQVWKQLEVLISGVPQSTTPKQPIFAIDVEMIRRVSASRLSLDDNYPSPFEPLFQATAQQVVREGPKMELKGEQKPSARIVGDLRYKSPTSLVLELRLERYWFSEFLGEIRWDWESTKAAAKLALKSDSDIEALNGAIIEFNRLAEISANEKLKSAVAKEFAEVGGTKFFFITPGKLKIDTIELGADDINLLKQLEAEIPRMKSHVSDMISKDELRASSEIERRRKDDGETERAKKALGIEPKNPAETK